MSIECRVCERDLRSDHECSEPLCPRKRGRVTRPEDTAANDS